MNISSKRGMSVVEVVIFSAVIVSLITAATGAWQIYFKVSQAGNSTTQSALLTEEASEAIGYLRDRGWSKFISPLSLNTPYYIYWNSSTYATSTTPVSVQGKYYVSFIISAVNRDASNDNIVTSGGIVDPKTRKVAIKVVSVLATTSPLLQTEMIIHDIYNN